MTDFAGRFRLILPDSGNERVTACKEGYFIAGQRTDHNPISLMLEPLPRKDNPEYTWVDSTPGHEGNCGNCHQAIFDEWRVSGHARSATGRRFRNLYSGADWNGKAGVSWNLLADNPLGAGVCASCHAPTLATDSHTSLGDLLDAGEVAAQGVHCDYCHKISGLGSGVIGLTHGSFNIDLLRPRKGQVFFGPLDDVDRGDDAFSPFYKDSRFCASCHEGVIFGVHVYSTFSEWQASPAKREGKQCQSCHMKPTGMLTNIAPGKGGIERDPQTLANHRFFAESLDEMLKKCLHVTTHVSPSRNGVEINIKVQADEVGHAVPTGFVDRHLLLIVEGFDEHGRQLSLQEGPTLPAVVGKNFAGRPGRLYGKLVKDFDGHSPAPFWRADPHLTDIRLRPGEPDRTQFAFPATVAKVQVRLIYCRFWHEVAEAKKWPDNEMTIIDRAVAVESRE